MSSLGRVSLCIAAYMVECTTACPARAAILRQDGSPTMLFTVTVP